LDKDSEDMPRSSSPALFSFPFPFASSGEIFIIPSPHLSPGSFERPALPLVNDERLTKLPLGLVLGSG
jgi:hypothetical protein